MSINFRRTRECLKEFDFTKLFIDHLGWGNAHGRATTLVADELRYRATPIAELGGMVVFLVEPPAGAALPDTRIQKRLERDLSKIAHEHLSIFLDTSKTQATFLWVKRGIHASAQDRRHTHERGQPGDALLRKLAGIAFRSEDLDTEGRASIVDVLARIEKQFGSEKITKRFYEDFKKQHQQFLDAIKGIDDDDDHAWYTSVMLNRVMFIYFLQHKNLLDNDTQYLAHKLAVSKKVGANKFYREFLTTLFFEGFAHEENQRDAKTKQLLGRVPYLNGGLFTRHQIEDDHDGIEIPDRAFERLFEFFDGWDWVLEPRPAEYYIEHPNAKEEINPDVLGYIFEKYINQKEMGAYYTKEDITGYICRNTILPFLMDKLGRLRHTAVNPLPLAEIDAYIYPAVSQQEYLPTETEREYAARQKRLKQILADFKAGKMATINDFITYNLDIEAFMQDFLGGLTDPLTLRAFYFEGLKKLTVLDPTVGSGAFLFAAMNILEPLYEICLDKMEELANEKYADFRDELARIAQHPNRAYFIFKSIIVNNLYGVDLSEEATEICKLRLFLKLVAQVERDDHKPNLGIEPLPDIDFNIRAGNTLVGYASLDEIEQASKRSLFASTLPQKIREADTAIRAYRTLQTQMGISARDLAQAKKQTKQKLGEIERTLNETLSAEYGARSVDKFAKSHQPLHWYVEFNQIMQDGGFDVIVGNPPYVEYKTVKNDYTTRGFATEPCGDLYAFVLERSLSVLANSGRCGLIVPVSFVSTDGFATLRTLVTKNCDNNWFSTYAMRPSKLFDGAEKHLCIWLSTKNTTDTPIIYSTRYHRWTSDERKSLFSLIQYVRVPKKALYLNAFPKIGAAVERDVLLKLLASNKTLGSQSASAGKYVLYHTRKLRYFVQFIDRAPVILEKGGKKRVTSELKEVRFGKAEDRDVALAAYCSTLFFWYFLAFSDCRNLNKREVEAFPLDLSSLSKSQKTSLANLKDELMENLQDNSEMRVMDYQKYGKLEVQVFSPRLSKPIVDRIDRVLAEHYGFTDEELDFIINYDIKYRMGREAEEE